MGQYCAQQYSGLSPADTQKGLFLVVLKLASNCDRALSEGDGRFGFVEF